MEVELNTCMPFRVPHKWRRPSSLTLPQLFGSGDEQPSTDPILGYLAVWSPTWLSGADRIDPVILASLRFPYLKLERPQTIITEFENQKGP